MTRWLIVCAALLGLTTTAWCEDTKFTVVRLKLRPASLPTPALKYQLLPELPEMKPGNPIQAYLKCFAEQNNFFFSKQANDQREKWSKMPLDKLPAAKMRGYGGSALRHADYAARLETPDWQALTLLQEEGAEMLLPEVQQMRMLARALHVRIRGQLADKRFDDALKTAKTMLAMARHFSEHPALISHLVGIAIGFITLEPLEEMIQQPGSPNMYWALTTLPKPLVPLHKGIQGERMMWRSELKILREDVPMTDAQLRHVMEKLGKPKGLIAYSTLERYEACCSSGGCGTQKSLQPSLQVTPGSMFKTRAVLYFGLWAAVGVALTVALLTRDSLDANIRHDRNPQFVTLSDGSIRNGYQIKILNKRLEPRRFQISVEGAPRALLRRAGSKEPAAPTISVLAPADDVLDFRLLVERPRIAINESFRRFKFRVVDTARGEEGRYAASFHAPSSFDAGP